jgi:hypothetical protein
VAIDNIQRFRKPINEVIEWTDDYGVVVATGSNGINNAGDSRNTKIMVQHR